MSNNVYGDVFSYSDDGDVFGTVFLFASTDVVPTVYGLPIQLAGSSRYSLKLTGTSLLPVQLTGTSNKYIKLVGVGND